MALSCVLRGVIRQVKVNPVSQILKTSVRSTSCLPQKCLYQDKNPVCFKNNPSLVSAVKHLSTTPVCKSAHGDHSKIWTAERFLSLGLLGIVPTALLVPSQPLDILMSLCVVMHIHWGIEAVVVDYMRPSVVGPTLSKIGILFVYALSVGTLAGLLNFIFNDVGLANGIRMLWKL